MATSNNAAWLGRHVASYVKIVRYIAFNAPWTLVSTLSAGLSTYVITIMLSKHFGLAAAGQFRLLLSIVAMLSLFSLLDTGKIVIRYLVQGAEGVIRPLLLNRFYWSLGGLVAGLATAAVFYFRGNELAPAVMVAALLLPLMHPSSLFSQINQSRKQFRYNATLNVIKFASLTALAVGMTALNADLVSFFIGYFILFTMFNVYYMSRYKEVFEAGSPKASTYVSEAVKLSASGLFPVILQHADKFLISYFFGLEALGLYTIGVSTGRLMLHFVKPILVIYFPTLVNKRFGARLQILSFTVLTAIGLVAAYVMSFYFDQVLGREYLSAYPIAAVIVAGLGIYFVGVTKYYSSVYYKDTSLTIPVVTNLTMTPIIIGYLVLSLAYGGDYALVLCAFSYPLRELVNMSMIVLLDRVFEARAERSEVR